MCLTCLCLTSLLSFDNDSVHLRFMIFNSSEIALCKTSVKWNPFKCKKNLIPRG